MPYHWIFQVTWLVTTNQDRVNFTKLKFAFDIGCTIAQEYWDGWGSNHMPKCLGYFMHFNFIQNNNSMLFVLDRKGQLTDCFTKVYKRSITCTKAFHQSCASYHCLFAEKNYPRNFNGASCITKLFCTSANLACLW